MIELAHSLPRCGIGRRSIPTVVLCLFVTTLPLRAQEHTPESRRNVTSLTSFSRTVDGGTLFLDGVHIEGPYRILATIDSMTVNGLPFPWQISRDSEDDTLWDDMDDQAEWSGRSRRGGWRRGGSERRATPVRAARDIAERLEGESVLVAFTELSYLEVGHGSGVIALYDALLASPPTEEQISEVLNFVPGLARQDAYRGWLLSFQGRPPLNAMMQTEVDLVRATEQQGLTQAAALMRLDRFSYPLTLAGMLLGVIAMGHMLRWTGRSLVTDQGDQCSPESVRCAEIALLLMLGMSVVDLLWTILAGQAGLMKELNPLAASFMDSPTKLALFKVTATLLGCGILYAIRSRKNGQTAVWWMCLVCVLVTFRWVMFDSMTA